MNGRHVLDGAGQEGWGREGRGGEGRKGCSASVSLTVLLVRQCHL